MPDEVKQGVNRLLLKGKEGLATGSQIYLAIGTALLIGLLVSSYMQASAGFQALQKVSLANQRIDHLDSLNRHLLQLETSVRGYLLTADARFMNSYQTSRPNVERVLATISQEYPDGHAQYGSTHALLGHAAGVVDSLGLALNSGIQESAKNNALLEQNRLMMERFQRQYGNLKVSLLGEYLQQVKNSESSFSQARTSTQILAVLSLVLMMLAVAQSQKRRELSLKITQLLKEDNARLENEVRARTQELSEFSAHQTNVREAEMQRLARELHDELGALLTAAKIDVDWLERHILPHEHDQVEQRLARLQTSLISGIKIKRRFVNDLRPALLYELGLLEAIRAQVDSFPQRGEIKFNLVLPDTEPDLPEAVSLNLFRIVQEACTNIQKHAKATQVDITLVCIDSDVILTITDNGVGFDMDEKKLSRHGLVGIKQRVLTHSGRLDISSSPGKGTTLTAAMSTLIQEDRRKAG